MSFNLTVNGTVHAVDVDPQTPLLWVIRDHIISSNGGVSPAWSRNGRELFYLGGSTKPGTALMMAVDVSTTGDFKAGVPHELFEWVYSNTSPLRSYDVTPDGQFIVNQEQHPPNEPVSTLHVVLGWAEELKAKVPARK